MKRTTYLVDTENVHSVWKLLLNDMGSRDTLILMYTENSPGISYIDLKEILDSGKSFDMIRCYPGKNGLDFQLVTYLGYLMKSAPKTEYQILSNDSGFDSVVRFWTDRGMKISRISTVALKRSVERKKEEERRLLEKESKVSLKAEIVLKEEISHEDQIKESLEKEVLSENTKKLSDKEEIDENQKMKKQKSEKKQRKTSQNRKSFQDTKGEEKQDVSKSRKTEEEQQEISRETKGEDSHQEVSRSAKAEEERQEISQETKGENSHQEVSRSTKREKKQNNVSQERKTENEQNKSRQNPKIKHLSEEIKKYYPQVEREDLGKLAEFLSGYKKKELHPFYLQCVKSFGQEKGVKHYQALKSHLTDIIKTVCEKENLSEEKVEEKKEEKNNNTAENKETAEKVESIVNDVLPDCRKEEVQSLVQIFQKNSGKKLQPLNQSMLKAFGHENGSEFYRRLKPYFPEIYQTLV